VRGGELEVFMENAPMKITLYDPETNEIRKEYIRSFVPWRLLKKAIRLSKRLSGVDEESISEEDADAIASLVVDTFGDQFTVEELNQGASLGEMMTVLRIIIAEAEGISLNPPPQGKRN
jgi:hypothetical protein